MSFRIVVLGGYGTFGSRIARELARTPGVDLLIAGRSADAGAVFARALRPRSRAPPRSTRSCSTSPRRISPMRWAP